MNTSKSFLLLIILLVLTSCSISELPEEPILEDFKASPLEGAIAGVQNARLGEYLVVFKDDESLKVNNLKDELITNPKFIENTSKIKIKAQSVLISANLNKKIGSLFVSLFQGFSISNITNEEAKKLENDDRVSSVVPNLIYNENTEDKPEITKNRDNFVQLPSGDYMHAYAKYVGFQNVINRNERIFMLGSGINRAAWSQLRIDYLRAISVMPGLDWSQDPTYDGAGNAVLLAAKLDGRFNVGIAAGAKLVPVKAKHNFIIQLVHLMDALEYTYNNSNSTDYFVYSPNKYQNQPTHPIISRALSNLSRKIVGAMSIPSQAGIVNNTTVPPYQLNLSKLWISGVGRGDFSPANGSTYGYNIDTWAPAQFTSAIIGPNQIYTWYGGHQAASAMTIGVLYARGNNTIGTQGNINYYGYNAPKLRIQ